MSVTPELPHVYSAAEIARVAGVRPHDVDDLASAREASYSGPGRKPSS